jgi:hypothetical protein
MSLAAPQRLGHRSGGGTVGLVIPPQTVHEVLNPCGSAEAGERRRERARQSKVDAKRGTMDRRSGGGTVLAVR